VGKCRQKKLWKKNLARGRGDDKLKEGVTGKKGWLKKRKKKQKKEKKFERQKEAPLPQKDPDGKRKIRPKKTGPAENAKKRKS